MKSQNKKKVGRPTKYKPEYCQLLIEHMATGHSFETFGSTIGVSFDRVWEWAKKHPEFKEAKDIAEMESYRFWEKVGIGGTLGKIKGFNSTTWVFTMKNRFRWRERTEVKETDSFDKINHKKIMDYINED